MAYFDFILKFLEALLQPTKIKKAISLGLHKSLTFINRTYAKILFPDFYFIFRAHLIRGLFPQIKEINLSGNCNKLFFQVTMRNFK